MTLNLDQLIFPQKECDLFVSCSKIQNISRQVDFVFLFLFCFCPDTSEPDEKKKRKKNTHTHMFVQSIVEGCKWR